MQKIGTADIIWDRFENFIREEKEHSEKREPGWCVAVRDSVPREIENIIWSCYEKTGEGTDSKGRGCPYGKISSFLIPRIKKHQEYLKDMDLSWNLLFLSNGVAVLQSGKLTIGIPADITSYQLYRNLDDYSIAELKGEARAEFSLIGKDSISKNEVKGRIQNKQKEIDDKKKELENLQKEKEEELERIKQELEAKYADKMQLINAKKEEMEEQMNQLNQQMFLLDTEIYGIRCVMGETIQFVPLVKGSRADEKEPVVFFQKIRFLDEELGKWISIYNFDGNDIPSFEAALKTREDLRELFAPGPKSVSVIKISKNNTRYGASEMVSNVLTDYDTFHGKQIGILVRDGENLYIGWTDEEKIQISDENVYLKPEKREDSIDDAESNTQTKEEVASRYFIFSILQGILNDGKLLKIPEKVNVLKPSPYIIFSMADGWLEDNRYGTFADIVDRTDVPLMKGDMILTTLRIERDDAGLGNIWNNGRTTKYDKWNNDRGRGEKNRTHDAYIQDKTVVPINLVDTTDSYMITEKKYRLLVREVPTETIREGSTTVTRMRYETTKTEEYLGDTISYLYVKNGKLYDRYDVRKMSPEEILSVAKVHGYIRTDVEQINPINTSSSYYTAFKSIEYMDTEKEYFVSAKKSNGWNEEKDSFANMEIRANEYLNLTFLNSIYLVYAIRNRKIGGWRRGNVSVDYANSIPYLKKALDYIRERESAEADMLSKYMDLYDGWQVDVSEWRLKHNYHRLTDTRAKKFAAEKNITGV